MCVCQFYQEQQGAIASWSAALIQLAWNRVVRLLLLSAVA